MTVGKRAPACAPAVVTAILLLATLVSCAPAASVGESAPSGQRGMSVERLRRLDRAIQRYVDDERIAGAVTLVARGGRIVHLQASGYEDVESGKAMQTDSLFRMYSMTKPVTSVALLMLYEQGCFQLDDPLDEYIPQFAQVMVYDGMDDSGRMKLVEPDRKITIRDIFTHTGGISYGNGDDPVDAAYREAGIAYGSRDLKDLVEKIAEMPLRQQPGTYWHYSFSHDIQAYLVQRFSGMPFARYLEENIFEPLGMRDSSFGLPESKLDRGSDGQFGWSGAASTHVIMDPREDLVAILLLQQRPALLRLQKQFQTFVYQALIEPRKTE